MRKVGAIGDTGMINSTTSESQDSKRDLVTACFADRRESLPGGCGQNIPVLRALRNTF
jgi:hypothetical protein